MKMNITIVAVITLLVTAGIGGARMSEVKIDKEIAKICDATSSAPNDQLQLDVDRFNELFDWLSLEELVAYNNLTCARMHRIVGDYIRTNYGAIKFDYTSTGIRKSYQGSNLIAFSSFLKQLMFPYLEYIPYDFWSGQWEAPAGIIPQMKADQFKSLTEILLKRVVLTDAGIERIKDILGQLQTVNLKFPYFLDQKKDFHESFLQFCTEVNRLCIQGSTNSAIVGADNSWLARKYPTLEHFELIMNEAGPIDELKTFFEQNTNVKTFATDVEMIVANSDTFKNTKAKWDVLSVKFCHANTFQSSRDLLNDLYDRGLFSELHVYFSTLYDSTFNPESANTLISFNGLTTLFIHGMRYGIDLTPLTSLKQLYIMRDSEIANTTELATKLINLESIQFMYASIDNVLEFVRHSRNLTAIVVYRLECKGILDIEELNKERSKLSNARKTTIYVEESVYLAVKRATNRTDWNSVEIRRGSSYDAFNPNFEYMDYPDRKF